MVHEPHAQHAEYYPLWIRCEDAIEGSHRIKSKGVEYLPRLEEQTDLEYTKYKQDACFYNQSGRTKDGLEGYIFRKEPVFEVMDSMKPLLDDLTMNGCNALDYCKLAVGSVLTKGRLGALIDWNEDEQRPFVVSYCAEQIVNWDQARFQGQTLLSLVVLKECIPHPDNYDDSVEDLAGGTPLELPLVDLDFDYFNPPTMDQYRAFRLIPDANGDPVCTVEIWQPKAKTEKGGEENAHPEFINTDRRVLMRRKEPLREIPFVFFGPKDASPTVQKPPLVDVVDINLSQYVTSADLEQSRHFLGCPTPWVAGFPENSVLRIGSRVAWVSDKVDAKAGFMSMEATGLTELREGMIEKDQKMAALGARMLEGQKADAETAQTLEIRKSGEACVLVNISKACSNSMTRVFQWLAYWIGTDPDPDEIKGVECMMNNDFLVSKLSAQEQTALMMNYIQGGMSFEVLFYNWQRAELIPPNRTMEQERAAIESAPPPAGAPGIPALPPPIDPNKQKQTPDNQTPGATP